VNFNYYSYSFQFIKSDLEATCNIEWFQNYCLQLSFVTLLEIDEFTSKIITAKYILLHEIAAATVYFLMVKKTLHKMPLGLMSNPVKWLANE